MKNYFELIKKGEALAKPRKTPPIPVPAKWYNEMINELAKNLMITCSKPSMQFRRIEEVKKEGKGFEVMKNGIIVTLEDLKKFYEDALKDFENIPKLAKERIEFKQKFTPIKNLKGNISAAKKEIELKKIKNPIFTDFNYKELHRLSNKYYLCNSEMTVLMDYMSNLNII